MNRVVIMNFPQSLKIVIHKGLESAWYGLVRINFFLYGLNQMMEILIILVFFRYFFNSMDDCGVIPAAQQRADGLQLGGRHIFT